MAHGTTSLSGRLRPVPEGSRFRPASRVTLDHARGAAVSNCGPRRLVLGLGAPRVDQRSRATDLQVRGPTRSTSCPGVLRGPAGPTRSPGPLALAFKGPQVRPAVPGDWGPGQKDFGVDQLSWANRAWVRGPTSSTSCPGQLALGSEGPWGRPDVRGDSRLFLRSRGIYHLSQLLGPWSEGPRG